jgi:cysteine desulfurase
MSKESRLSSSYLDNNATTCVDERVFAAMAPLFRAQYGNASSTHHFGAQLAGRVEEARSQVARLINARAREIVFTSGATESNNAALFGLLAAQPEKRHVVITSIEHAAVLEPAAELERRGYRVTRLAVNGSGFPDLDELEAAVSDDTAVVSCMLCNNETGLVLPVAEVVARAHARGVPVHTDAVQAIGKLDVDVKTLGVDLLSLTAHKIHGPKGVGALYVRRGLNWRPMIFGGPQERNRRGGTTNVPGVIGFGVAAELARTEWPAERERVTGLRDRLEAGLTERLPNAVVIDREQPRNGFTSCVCFAGVEAEAVLLLLSERGICVSSGAACSSGSLEPSHVLKAMGVDPHVAQGQIRFSLSRFTTAAEIDHVVETLPTVIEKVAAVNI